MNSDKVVYGWYHNKRLFYVGIGERKRAYSSCSRNSHCSNKRRKAERENSFEVKILYSGLTWEEACEIECQLIQQFGRRDLGTGSLTNMTNGGDGVKGYRHSNQVKEKMSNDKQGDKNPMFGKSGSLNPFYGRNHNPETLMSMSKSKEKSVMTPLGEFDSCKEAATVLPCCEKTIGNRARNMKFSEYYFT